MDKRYLCEDCSMPNCAFRENGRACVEYRGGDDSTGQTRVFMADGRTFAITGSQPVAQAPASDCAALMLQQVIAEAWDTAEKHGWHDDDKLLAGVLGRFASTDEQWNAWLASSVPSAILKEIGHAREIWETNRKLAKIDLMHAELSEATEAIRKGDGENEAEELADVVIRIGDYCGAYGIDLVAAVVKKMAYNKGRPYKHGGKKA